MRRVIAVNEAGRRIGFSHHNAKLPDEIIDQIRDLHEDALIGYQRISMIFNVSKSFVQKVCNYERRAQIPKKWKTVTE